MDAWEGVIHTGEEKSLDEVGIVLKEKGKFHIKDETFLLVIGKFLMEKEIFLVSEGNFLIQEGTFLLC